MSMQRNKEQQWNKMVESNNTINCHTCKNQKYMKREKQWIPPEAGPLAASVHWWLLQINEKEQQLLLYINHERVLQHICVLRYNKSL